MIIIARHNMNLHDSKDWTKADKITWTNVSDQVGRVLKILCPHWVSFYNDEDHYLSKLAEVSVADLKAATIWLDEHRGYLFTNRGVPSNWYDGRQFKVATQPQVCYNRKSYYGARGLASTYRNRAFLVGDEAIALLNKAITQHSVLVNDAKRGKFTGYLQLYERQTNDSEKDSRSYYMDEYQIANAAVSTFTAYRNGQSKSTHGDWSFGLGYSTYYIGKDGELLPFDEEKLRDDWLDKIESLVYPDLIEQGTPLIERNVELQRVFYQRSQMWYKVMHHIHNAMYNVYLQYPANQEEE